MKPTPEQLAAAKAYFAAKPKPIFEQSHQYRARALAIRREAARHGLRPQFETVLPLEDFAPALASVLSAGLLGEVKKP